MKTIVVDKATNLVVAVTDGTVPTLTSSQYVVNDVTPPDFPAGTFKCIKTVTGTKEADRVVTYSFLRDTSFCTLAQVREFKKWEMKMACAVACESGITSNALGSDHYYPTRTYPHHDQFNLMAKYNKAVKEVSTPGWTDTLTCAPNSNRTHVKREVHTAAQIIEVAVAVQEMISANLDKLYSKYAAIDAAQGGLVDGITW